MKKNIPYANPVRHYRKLVSAHEDEQKIQIIQEETDLLITLPRAINTEYVGELCHHFVEYMRRDLKYYIEKDPRFFHSLEPIDPIVREKCSSLVYAMCEASRHAHVGPFAAVAGSIAQMTASMLFIWISHFLEYSEKNLDIIVENGGDIYMYSAKERVVGLLAKPKEKEHIGIKIKSASCPLSFCASSSTIGHSLSFGNGDIAMVMAKNGALADALATSYCNALKTSKDIESVLQRAQEDSHLQLPNTPFAYEEIMEFLQEYSEKRACEAFAFKNKRDKKTGARDRKNVEKEIGNLGNLGKRNTRGGVLGVFLQCDGLIGAWGDIELVVV